MKIASAFVSLLVTVTLIVILNRPIGSVPPIGQFLSPQHGFWQNAEPIDHDYSGNIDLSGLAHTVDIFFDDRMVPHVFAQTEQDAWFAQGYLHAKFRLWQMEFQTHAAAGRLTEILGAGPDDAYLNNDRNMRRVGMLYGAKRSLEEMEKDSLTNAQLDAYTAGVNNYISQLTQADLPLEYRLLNYLPEPWTNLKTALFLKYMSYDLTGYETDIEYTNARNFFSAEDFQKLFPVIHDSSSPVIPRGTVFPEPALRPAAPATADSLYFGGRGDGDSLADKPDKHNGSNNWVATGSKTRSGRPILCNDPHLGLNLPSLWFEMQIHTPDFNVYGVSFPGAPAIIIGFNEHIAWGVTNAARDVRDYYSIRFRDHSKKQYWFNEQWKGTEIKTEEYRIRDGRNYVDTIAYTVFGPVMYDNQYNGNGRVKNNLDLAVRWKAHDPSNELKTFLLLDRAENYNDYVEALATFVCPGQNFAFAGKSGDIAVWQQGSFPAKWKGQGDFIMPGYDSSYMWQGSIAQEENLHDINDPRGFVSSANQLPADTTYPYYLGGHYDLYRGLQINRNLSAMEGITVDDMKNLQNNNFNAFAADALPFLLAKIQLQSLSAEENRLLAIVGKWNYRNDAQETGPSIFVSWIESLQQQVWADKFPTEKPEEFTTIALLKDSFVNNVEDVVTRSFQSASKILLQAEKEGRLRWDNFKDAGIRHLLRLEPLSRFHLSTGGGYHVINATKQFHGPSWKMIVELTDEINAWGIYPGGQSGNPGSRYYDPFVNDWSAGKYYRLWLMSDKEKSSPKIKYHLKMSKS